MRDLSARPSQAIDPVTPDDSTRTADVRLVPRPTWAVLLAGGDGTRLMGTRVNGMRIDRPKQFCRFDRDDSLLGSTLHRARRLPRPCTILPVVSEPHRRWWQAELRHIPAADVLVQPANRGTGVALLHALLHVLQAGDDNPLLVVYPCDHGVRDEAPLLRALERALEAAAESPRDVVLVGVAPESPETQFGWIVPDERGRPGATRVRAFVEKPGAAAASALMERGGLWNSFLFAASARALLGLFLETHPRLVEAYLWKMPRDGWRERSLAECYAALPDVDFSHDVLERSVANLMVVPVRGSGWTDLGTPARLEAWLRPQHGRVAAGSAHRPMRLLTMEAGAK
jgi:mannose-1-phosphate guanylyltransferase